MTLLLITASSLNAGQCTFQMKCEQGKQTSAIEFKSPAGDCLEDDMQASVTVVGKSEPLAFPPKWYSPVVHMLKTKSDCRDGDEAVAGFFLDDNHLLFFVTASGRPGYDNIVAALVNVKEKKLLHQLDLGKSKETLIPVLKTKNGYKLRVVREFLSDVMCDCSAGFTDDWMEVRLVNGKLQTAWMK